MAYVVPRIADAEESTRREEEAARQELLGTPATVPGEGGPAAEPALLRRLEAVSGALADAKSAAAAACPPVPRAETEALCDALGALSQPGFEAALGLVLHRCPGLQPTDGIGFDLATLDALTLRQLASFVRAAAAGAEQGATPVWPDVGIGAGVPPKKARPSKAGGVAGAGGAATASSCAVHDAGGGVGGAREAVIGAREAVDGAGAAAACGVVGGADEAVGGAGDRLAGAAPAAVASPVTEPPGGSIPRDSKSSGMASESPKGDHLTSAGGTPGPPKDEVPEPEGKTELALVEANADVSSRALSSEAGGNRGTEWQPLPSTRPADKGFPLGHSV